jgi:hypothetical protein
VLLLASVALVAAGSAGAATGPKLFHVVKRAGPYTATLTYVQRSRANFTGVSLRIRRGGSVVLSRKICLLHPLSYGHSCQWGPVAGPPRMSVRAVGPNNAPAFVLNLWNGGNHCCTDTFIAVAGSKLAWLTREWSGADGWEAARIRRIHGRNVFVSGDGRFFCEFSSCAGATVPIQIWKIDAADRFVNVTRSYPSLIRQNARELAAVGGRRMTIRKQGAGVLAAWCGDEYLLGAGSRCSQTLQSALKRHQGNDVAGRVTRGFIRTLNRDLRRWGYTG